VSRPHAKILIGAAVVVIVALAVGLTLWLTSDDEQTPLSHEAYAQLYDRAVLQQTRIAVIDDWPKPPYQDFHDNAQNRCFEWWDKPVALYTLCFKNGLLASKNKN
jgi:hypothetical protein